MKKRKLVACLMAGVLVLAVSAGAAFESVNGYAAYKNGVKALLLQTNNVTLEGKFAVTVDGKTVTKANGTVATDGKNYSSEFWAEDSDGSKEESHDVYLDGVNTWYSGENAANKSYYSNEYDQEWNSWNNLLGYHEDDEMESRMITFLELAADSVVGDLKNNFVSLGSEDGLNKYQVEVSKQQVPALVNAGLSLMAYSQFSYTGYSTYHQDYEASLVSYYEKTTGQPFPQEIWDNYYEEWNDEWVEANQDTIDKFEEIQSDFSDIGYDVLEKKGGGVAYVKKDLSVDYYATQLDFYNAHPEECGDDWSLFIGKDLSLESVKCGFALDDKGRLAENSISAVFVTTDAKGERHTLTLEGSFQASNFDSTQIKPLDVTGWTNLSEED